jgi:polar amino acid transport system substrate-binding protein
MSGYYLKARKRVLKPAIFKKLKPLYVVIPFFIIITSFGHIGETNGTESQPKPKKTIVFATIFLENMSFFSEMSLIYAEAFKRLGYNFKLVNLPGERAMVDANSGVVDGEAGRIAYIDSNKYPNLIRVAEPIIVMKDGAYSADTSIKINGWESLRGKGFKVGLLKGVKSVEQKLPKYVEKENIVTLTDFEQCLKMLQARRIDVFIGATLVEESALMRSDKYNDIKRVGIIEEKALYPWFHKRHKDLVPKLADTLKTMKK